MNLKVRLKNPVFWVQLVLAVFTPVAAYMGLTAQDFTTWDKVVMVIMEAVRNPYVLTIVAVSVWNAINDPTTSGIGDSKAALTYLNPKKDD